jgi:CubicO group peptidase (beta-lactamase class C family)
LGGAGLVSTLRDYSKFAKLLLNKGKIGDIPLISEETFNLLCTPQVSQGIMPGNARWGLGVRVITDESYPYLPVGSFGWSGAYGSHFWIDPVHKIFAVYMKNSKIDGGAGNESAVKLEKAVYSSFAEISE